MKTSWIIYLFSISIFFIVSHFNLYKDPSRSIAEAKLVNARHVVFDLDWTLFSEFDPTLIKPRSDRVFYVEGKSYYLSPFAEELLRFLDGLNIKISFFSGGHESRNIALLESAKLQDGRSFYSIAYKVLSKSDLTVMSNDETLGFSDRFKKDLTRITDDLDSIILIDDNKNFALGEHQIKNIFWLGPTYQVLTKMDDVQLVQPKYLPPTIEAWDLSNHKLLIIKEAIREALFLEKSQRISFKEAMHRIQIKINFEAQKYSPYSKNLKTKGLLYLPNKSFSSVNSYTCKDGIEQFLLIHR